MSRLEVVAREVALDPEDDDEVVRRFLSGTTRPFFRRIPLCCWSCATRRACWARACACAWARYCVRRSSSSAASRIIWICSSVVRSGAPRTAFIVDGTSSEREPDTGVDQAVHDDDGGEAGDDVGKRSSSEM